MAVYPLNNYGAIQVGIHRFYAIAEGKKDQLTETGRFTQVWKKEDGKWKLARVLSYDHKLAE
jgi:ketosteroid isomerase-like protein